MYSLFRMGNTVDGERFTGINIHGFNAIKVFVEIFSRCLGHKQCISTLYLVQLKGGTYIHGKFLRYSWKLWKPRKFSPANLSPFMVVSNIRRCIYVDETSFLRQSHIIIILLYISLQISIIILHPQTFL